MPSLSSIFVPVPRLPILESPRYICTVSDSVIACRWFYRFVSLSNGPKYSRLSVLRIPRVPEERNLSARPRCSSTYVYTQPQP